MRHDYGRNHAPFVWRDPCGIHWVYVHENVDGTSCKNCGECYERLPLKRSQTSRPPSYDEAARLAVARQKLQEAKGAGNDPMRGAIEGMNPELNTVPAKANTPVQVLQETNSDCMAIQSNHNTANERLVKLKLDLGEAEVHAVHTFIAAQQAYQAPRRCP